MVTAVKNGLGNGLTMTHRGIMFRTVNVIKLPVRTVAFGWTPQTFCPFSSWPPSVYCHEHGIRQNIKSTSKEISLMIKILQLMVRLKTKLWNATKIFNFYFMLMLLMLSYGHKSFFIWPMLNFMTKDKFPSTSTKVTKSFKCLFGGFSDCSWLDAAISLVSSQLRVVAYDASLWEKMPKVSPKEIIYTFFKEWRRLMVDHILKAL